MTVLTGFFIRKCMVVFLGQKKVTVIMQARRQGGARGVHAPPQEAKGPLDGIVKDLKWYKTNVVVVGLTICMHFQQF